MVLLCDWITAPSRELLNKTIEIGYPANRTTYIPNGVDINRFKGKIDEGYRSLSLNGKSINFPRDACVVLCARRFVYKNGIHIYLDALESITPDVLSQCVFIFAGNKFVPEDDYECEISKRIDVLSRKAGFHMLGPVTNELMPEVYKVADISVLPSLIEATSITGLESMATGLPIVGTNAGGIPEIVEDGYNGLIGPAGDFSALAANLVRLIEDSKLRREMGAAGRQCAEKAFFVATYRRSISGCLPKCIDRTTLQTKFKLSWGCSMTKVAVFVGTRPEVIKMAPIIMELRRRTRFDCSVISTGQHETMSKQAMKIFGIIPDIELDVMQSAQDLSNLTSRLIVAISETLKKVKPDIILVQGDTTTVLSASISAFYQRIPVGHVEAGLRSYDYSAPWPEEMNRRITELSANGVSLQQKCQKKI